MDVVVAVAVRAGRLPLLGLFEASLEDRHGPSPASVAVAIIAVTAVIGTMSLAGNEDLYYIERGLTGPLSAQ